MLKLSATLLDDLHNTEIPKLVAVLWFSAILMILFSVGISSGQAALAKTPSASLPLPGTEPVSPPSAPKAPATTATETTVQPGESIEAAIQNLPEEGGTILLVSGETYVQNDINITKTVTIKTTDAEKATIDGDGDKIFLANGHDHDPGQMLVSIQNLNIRNANTDFRSGCFDIRHIDTNSAGEGGFEIISCKFSECHGSVAGAAQVVYSDGTFSGSTFISNTSFSRGGALNLLYSDVELHNSIFTNNEVTDGSGGALYIDLLADDTDTSFVSGSIITGNRAPAIGPGIHYSGILTDQAFLVDSTVVSNTLTEDSDYGQAVLSTK